MLKLYVPVAWLIGGFLSGMLVAPREHGSIVIVYLAAIAGAIAAALHLLTLFVVRRKYATANLTGIVIGIVSVGLGSAWFAIVESVPVNDFRLLASVGVANLISSQLVYWLFVRPAVKAVVNDNDEKVT